MQYSEDIESEMVKFYNSLSEKDKRRYAAVEEKSWVMGESSTYPSYLDVTETQ